MLRDLVLIATGAGIGGAIVAGLLLLGWLGRRLLTAARAWW